MYRPPLFVLNRSLSEDHKRQPTYNTQRVCARSRKRVRKQNSNEFTICTGWMQEWVSPRQLRRNNRLEVRDVVRGPFFSPKLLRTQPYVNRSCRGVKENINYGRRGIPDAWREYLASRGHCGATEARVLQKNLIPCYVRCLATDRLWNDLGLAFVQGIPDPWKDSFRLPGNVCKKRSTQIIGSYDADDEAETEDFVTSYCRSAEQHRGGMRDHPYIVQRELNLPPHDKKTFRTVEHISSNAKDKQNKIDQVTVGQSPKSSIPSVRLKNVGTIAEGASKIQKAKQNSYVRNKRVVVREESLMHSEKKLSAKTLSPTVTKPTIERNIQTNLIEKTNEDVCVVQPKMMQNFACCSFKLQNRIDSNVQRFPNCTSLLNEVNVLQHVLCKNCEDVYRGNNPRTPDPATNIINASEPIPKCCSRRQKIVEYGKICKRTRLKLCGCMQKTKQQFDNFSCPGELEKGDVIVYQDLKLVCCRCDCPYLRIASPNPIDRKTGSSDRQSCRIQNDHCVGPRERRRVSKYAATRKHGSNCNNSENRSRTRAENKANVSKRDLQRTLHSKAAKRSEASNKNVDNYPKSDADCNNQIKDKNKVARLLRILGKEIRRTKMGASIV